MARRISKKERHIRWNWEESQHDPEKTLLHLVVVDDKNREGKIRRILSQDGVTHGSVEQIRSVGGKVIGTRFRYLFETYEGYIDPKNINWNNVRKPTKRDEELTERKRGSVEDYVANLYEN